MEFVTVVNRTEKALWATWDGKKYQIKAGKNALPLIVAEAAKRQNPIMGSQDPITLEMQYKVGIEEQGDDCSALPILDPAIELMDRSKMGNARPTEVVRGDNGLYGGRVASALPLDASFVKP